MILAAKKNAVTGFTKVGKQLWRETNLLLKEYTLLTTNKVSKIHNDTATKSIRKTHI